MLVLKVELQCLLDSILEKLKREGGRRHSHFARGAEESACNQGYRRELRAPDPLTCNHKAVPLQTYSLAPS